MTSNKTFKIGLIIGSTRVRRVGPQIARFIQSAIQQKATDDPALSHLQSQTTTNLIDLQDYHLPIFDEPGIPNQIHSPEDYSHEHTRVWARDIASHDAFIFLSAQRNWGIPAELKNALDYLFHEWRGKPALIVSYGGHGGGKCAEQLRTVVGGALGMRVVEPMVSMAFPSKEFTQRALKGEELGLDAEDDEGPWAEHGGRIKELVWGEMVAKMLVEA